MSQTSFTAEPALPVEIAPDNPGIIYTGRIDFRDPKAPSFAFPGISIQADFQGTGIDVSLSGSDDQNYFNVSIDGAKTLVIQTVKGPKRYSIARKLTPGQHTIQLFKRTENSHAAFLGFRLDAGMTLLAPKQLYERKIEIYGDSITAGYGNEIAVADPSNFHFTPKNEDNQKAYGAIAARMLNAQYVAVCQSGHGIFRDFGGDESNPVPAFLNRIYPDQAMPVWDNQHWLPDVVIVALGANDYASELSRKDLSRQQFDRSFATAYGEFIGKLRQAYGPSVQIVCAIGQNRDWPQTNAFARVSGIVDTLVTQRRTQGDVNIHQMVLYDRIPPPYGEDFHPSAQTHQVLAERLVKVIRQVTGWD